MCKPDEQLVEQYWEEVQHTLKLAEDVFTTRAAGYDGVSVLDKFVYGDKSIFSLVWIKVQRLRSCIVRKEHGREVDAPLEDSILDAINYLAMLRAWYVVVDKKEKLP